MLAGPAWVHTVAKKLSPDLSAELVHELNSEQLLGAVIFTFFFCWCVVMLVILLLKLLVRMFGSTFAQVQQDLTLEWRLQLARKGIALEFVCPFEKLKRCGECFGSDGKHYHLLMHVRPFQWPCAFFWFAVSCLVL